MKKLLLAIVGLLSVTCVFADSSTKCLLQHQGEVTIFNGDNIQDAVNASVDGDTIFLSLGNFPAFTIDKRITVRGSGTSTAMGDVTISIPGEAELTQTVLEMSHVNNITLSSSMNGVRFSQLESVNNEKYLSASQENKNVYVDRCRLGIDGTNIDTLTCKNSSIVTNKARENATFLNCNVSIPYEEQVLSGNFISSIIYFYHGGNYSGQTLENCLFSYCYVFLADSGRTNIGNTSDTYECYLTSHRYNDGFSNSVYLGTSPYDEETLLANGYLGNDGTVVGMFGGSTPFSLVPLVPHVTEDPVISVDAETRQLSVSLKVVAQ